MVVLYDIVCPYREGLSCGFLDSSLGIGKG